MLNFLKVFKPIAADFLSTIVFIAILEITDNVVLSTGVGIASGIGQFLWFRYRGIKMELMQWASLVLVIVLGSATILTKDPRFMMVKPSIAGFAIACVMLKRGWQLRYIPPIVQENTSQGFLIGWGYLWSLLYFALAGANLYFALVLGKQKWEAFTAVVPMAAPLGLFLIQYVSMRWLVVRAVRARMAAPAE
ncbi:MAG TPA: septation protein IspZ [Rhizomicrobium sp.]|jgi:intracellular septation protein A